MSLAVADALMGIFGMKRVKLSKCKVCGAEYQKRNMMHVVCSTECTIEHAKNRRDKAMEQQARQQRKAIREQKEKLKTRSQWMKEAQIAFNAYIRERDKGQSCICCGKPLGAQQVGGGFDAGHYRSIGSAPHLRFDERNCHGQLKQCNRYGSGRAVDYRIGLIARAGLEAVEALEADNTPRKYTIEELKRIKAHYKAKLKQLKESRT